MWINLRLYCQFSNENGVGSVFPFCWLWSHSIGAPSRQGQCRPAGRVILLSCEMVYCGCCTHVYFSCSEMRATASYSTPLSDNQSDSLGREPSQPPHFLSDLINQNAFPMSCKSHLSNQAKDSLVRKYFGLRLVRLINLQKQPQMCLQKRA